MSLDRYDIDTCDGESGTCDAKFVKSTGGDYVLYDDVINLIADVLYDIQLVANDLKNA